MPDPAPVFQGLHGKLLELLKELDFQDATEAQQQAIPTILSGAHTLLLAPTGYGKTEAALLPVLDNYLRALEAYEARTRPVPAGVKILYLTPLRALNRDMLKRVQAWGQVLGLRVGVRHSDTSQAERRRQALKPPDLLITTPESLQIAFAGRRLRQNLKTVRWVVVDEIHELAGGERGYQLAVALERLEEVVRERPSPEVPSGFQRIGLSATVGAPGQIARLLAGPLREVETVEVRAEKKMELRVEHPHPSAEDRHVSADILVSPHQAAVLRRLRELLSQARSTLVFSNTRDGAELLGSRLHLYASDVPVAVHHGSLARDVRIEAEEAYKNGALRALICTSSLELGIDVGTTDLVVQNSSPRGVERLLQRVGRSGHTATRTAVGVILAQSGEDAAEAAVVARRALARQLDPVELRVHPLAVLANQLIHLTLEYTEVEFEFSQRLLARTAPFEGLPRPMLEQVLRQLEAQGTLSVDWKRSAFRRRASSRRYFVDNVSMIPDEKTYRVIDATGRRAVGSLDENFILSFVEPGAQFVMKGRTWQVVEVREDSVLVHETEALGAIPSWEGEDLPVPYSVAKEVGTLRRLAAGDRQAASWDAYPLDAAARRAFEEEVAAQLEKKLAVPTDEVITLEAAQRVVVVNACWGTRVNEALGRILAALLSQRTGEVVTAQIDAYRVVLESRGALDSGLVETVLREVQPDTVEALLRVILRNSSFLRYYMVHVARKFGALARNVEPSQFSLRRLLDLYRSQPMFEEAVEKVLWERMDTRHLREALRGLTAGQVRVVRQKLSPLGSLGRMKEQRMLTPSRPEPSILQTLRRRLEDSRILLACVACGRTREARTGDVPKRPECAGCGSILLVPLGKHERDVAKLLKRAKRTEDEERLVRRATNEAHLVGTYGKRAVLALAGRGVGPETAARILARMRDEELDFLRDILEAEIQYAKTRSFWD